MTTIEPAVRFPDLSPQAYAHPADRAARAALRSIPGVDVIVKKLAEFSYERTYRQVLLGRSVRLGDNQLPAVWAMQRQCAYVLDVEPCPNLYVTQAPVGDARAVGTNEPVILISSGMVSFSEEEVRSVLAHEMGHVHADHVGLLTTMHVVHQVLRGLLKGQPLIGLPLRAVYHALLEWSRMAELTSDRASAIVTGDPMLTCRSLMRMAGGPVSGLSLDAFIAQATEYHEERDPFARFGRFGSEMASDHPIPVRRVRELVSWVSSGDFDRIRSGEYLRRGQEPPPSEEFDAAFAHYRDRWSVVVDRAGTGVQDVFSRVSEWLGGSGPGESADAHTSAGFEGAEEV